MTPPHYIINWTSNIVSLRLSSSLAWIQIAVQPYKTISRSTSRSCLPSFFWGHPPLHFLRLILFWWCRNHRDAYNVKTCLNALFSHFWKFSWLLNSVWQPGLALHTTHKTQVHSCGSKYRTPRGADFDGGFSWKLLSYPYWFPIAFTFQNRTDLPELKTTGTIIQIWLDTTSWHRLRMSEVTDFSPGEAYPGKSPSSSLHTIINGDSPFYDDF